MLSCGTLSCPEPAQGHPAGAAPLVPSGPGGLPRRLTPASIPSCGQGRAAIGQPAGHSALQRSCSFRSWAGPWGSALACSVLAGPRLGSLEGLLVGEEHIPHQQTFTCPGDSGQVGGTPSLSRTLLSFKGFTASPALGLGGVVPRHPSAGGGDLLFPSQQGSHLYSAEGRLCFLPFGLAFFFFGFCFFQISEPGHCPSPNTPDSTPPPGVRPLQPHSSWPSAPGLENISGPGPPPRSLHPHPHPGGCWVSAQSHLWTNTVFSLTMRISNDPFCCCCCC